jgi:membrane-bound metal-dependent hydrolase YbcI (DUF457 family)
LTTFTHAAVGLGVASFFPESSPWLAVGFSLLPDLDHLKFLRTMRLKVGGMQHARTFMHELLGTVVYMAIGAALFLYDRELGTLFTTCLLTHLFCDFINGYSTPYKSIRDLPSVDMGKYLPMRVVQELTLGAVCIWLFVSA